MSDSDDTDVLLLIPPNFFLVNSDQESDSDLDKSTDRTIVGNLISHVNNLENRVNHIETLTSSRCTSLSDKSVALINIPENQVNSNSSFITDLDCRGDFNLIEPSYSLNIGNFNNNWNNRKHCPDTGSEFDNMDRLSTLDTLFQNGSPTKRLALPEVDKLLKEMEATQTEIENKLRIREIEHGIIDKNKHQAEMTSKKLYTVGDNIGSIPDRGFGVREMFTNSSQSSPIKGSNNEMVPVEEPCTKRDVYLVGSSNNDDVRQSLTSLSLSRSPLKDFTSPSKIGLMSSQENRRRSYISPRRRLQMNSDFGNGKSSSSKPVSDQRSELFEDRINADSGAAGDSQETRFKPDGGYGPKLKTMNNPSRGNLLSLAELWRSESDFTTDDPSKLKQKLEEEKYRRLHLENIVQTLQRRVLEEQEKVAVAMRVDEGKDRAIGQVTEAWKQMVQHWRQIESERHVMSQTLIAERSEITKQREEVENKIKRWEKEMSQALDLAAGFKAKYELVENELSTLKDTTEQKISELEENLMEKEAIMKELKDERKSLADRLQISKQELEEEKRIVECSRRDISMLQEQLSKCEAELTVVKEQRDLLSTRLREEKSRSSMLDAQKQALGEALDIANDKQIKAEEDIKAATVSLEKSKSELRAVYQSQLESVVRDKVAEFQAQLDRAQAIMQVELENVKRQTEEIAQRHQQALVNSHVVEMRRLESIHKEELKTLESKLVESERRRTRLENGKKDIAQRLHGVMESQWRQALNIITSELSMKQNDSGAGSRLAHIDEEDHLLSNKQRNLNLDDSTSSTTVIPSSRRRLSLKNTGGISLPPESETSDDHPFNKDGQITSRSNISAVKHPQLLNYIQTLLERQPGKPVDTTTSSFGAPYPDTDTTDEPHHHWAQVIQNNPSIFKDTPIDSLKQPMRKPPWKPT